MLDQLGGIKDLLTFLLLVVAIVAAAYGAFNKSSITTLRETNKDQADRIVVLEATEIRQGAQIVTLDAQNGVLRTIVTGEVQLASIETLLNTHHEQSERQWDKANRQLSAIRQSIEGKS